MTTAKPERCFSTLKRIKIFQRNYMNLWMIYIESNLTSKINDFDEKIIEIFFQAKNQKIDLIFKWKL